MYIHSSKFTLLALLSIIAFSINLYAQKNHVFSVSVMGGITEPAHAYGTETGWVMGFDIEARSNNFGLYFSSSYSASPQEVTTYTMEYALPSDPGHLKLFEISLGPRAYIGSMTDFNINIEAGVGLYGHTSSKKFQKAFGFNIGGGFNFPVAERFDISAKAKFHINDEEFMNHHVNYYLSLRYYFKK